MLKIGYLWIVVQCLRFASLKHFSAYTCAKFGKIQLLSLYYQVGVLQIIRGYRDNRDNFLYCSIITYEGSQHVFVEK